MERLDSITRLILALVIVAGLAPLLPGQTTFVETFDGGNEGAWTFGLPPVIDPTGGNPGAYLHVTGLDTFAPQPRTQDRVSEFTGNFAERQVILIGVDLITHAVDFGAGGRPLTLMLVNDN